MRLSKEWRLSSREQRAHWAGQPIQWTRPDLSIPRRGGLLVGNRGLQCTPSAVPRLTACRLASRQSSEDDSSESRTGKYQAITSSTYPTCSPVVITQSARWNKMIMII